MSDRIEDRFSARNRFRATTAPLILAVLSVAFSATSARADFIDGFEGSTIDPYWSTFLQNGSITLTTAIAHSGKQSAQFSSTDANANRYEQLFHNFATPTYGTASVWIYDTGAGVSSSNYIGFSLNNASTGFTAGLTTYDYGFQGNGPGRGDQYDYFDYSSTQNGGATGIYRTQAWHQYKVIDTPDMLSILLDGTTIYTRAGGTPFTQILLYSQAPGFRPAFSQYYDDFAFTPAAVPEPSSLILAVVGCVTIFGHQAIRRHRLNR